MWSGQLSAVNASTIIPYLNMAFIAAPFIKKKKMKIQLL